jgi:hypothetical protein
MTTRPIPARHWRSYGTEPPLLQGDARRAVQRVPIIPLCGVMGRQRGLRACAAALLHDPRLLPQLRLPRCAHYAKSVLARRVKQSRGPNGVFCAGSATPLVRAPGCATASDIRCRFRVGVYRKRATMRGVRWVIGGGDGAIRWRRISTAMARGPQDAYAPLRLPGQQALRR